MHTQKIIFLVTVLFVFSSCAMDKKENDSKFHSHNQKLSAEFRTLDTLIESKEYLTILDFLHIQVSTDNSFHTNTILEVFSKVKNESKIRRFWNARRKTLFTISRAQIKQNRTKLQSLLPFAQLPAIHDNIILTMESLARAQTNKYLLTQLDKQLRNK